MTLAESVLRLPRMWCVKCKAETVLIDRRNKKGERICLWCDGVLR